MNPVMQRLQAMMGGDPKRFQAMAAPLVVVAVLALMVLPLPPFLLDIFFTFNIATALMVMMVAATMLRPLDFAAFPAVLLPCNSLAGAAYLPLRAPFCSR